MHLANHTKVHVFYIDRNNTVKQATHNNDTDMWEKGAINDLNLKAFDSPSVGLQACWAGDYYGDDKYTGLSTPSDLNTTNTTKPSDSPKGMNIWFATDVNTFQQYSWRGGSNNNKWKKEEAWKNLNGRSGVACFSWKPNSTDTYAMMNTPSNTVQFYWKDTNPKLNSTKDHPINQWTKAASADIANVHPITSLGYTKYFYAQMRDRTIKGFNINYAAENTTFNEHDSFFVSDPAGPVKALGGTHLTVTKYTQQRDGKEFNYLYVFCQTKGDDIMAFVRDETQGQWSAAPLNILND